MELKFNFDYDHSILEEKVEAKADYLNYKFRDQFDRDEMFVITEIKVFFEDNECIGIKTNIRYITRNGWSWKYYSYKSEGERHHNVICEDHPEFSFDWWT